MFRYNCALCGDLGRPTVWLCDDCEEDIAKRAIDAVGDPLAYGRKEYMGMLKKFMKAEYPNVMR